MTFYTLKDIQILPDTEFNAVLSIIYEKKRYNVTLINYNEKYFGISLFPISKNKMNLLEKNKDILDICIDILKRDIAK